MGKAFTLGQANTVLLLATVMGILSFEAVATGAEYTNITTEDARALFDSGEDVLFLDVRETYEFDAGHITGALNMPWSSGYLQAHHGELPQKQTVVYCRSGSRSAAASQFLVDNGHENIFNMLGGYTAWTELPERTPTPTPSDEDGDGIPDLVEAVCALSGTSSLYLPDSDGDGLSDGIEDENLNGIWDEGETGALVRDSDNDLYEDGMEIIHYLSDPLEPGDPALPAVDGDLDGLPGDMDPDDALADYDGDRYMDGYEAATICMCSVLSDLLVPSMGDADLNGSVDNADAQHILNFFASSGLPAMHPEHSDLNRDGCIDNADAQVDLNFFARVALYLPYVRQ